MLLDSVGGVGLPLDVPMPLSSQENDSCPQARAHLYPPARRWHDQPPQDSCAELVCRPNGGVARALHGLCTPILLDYPCRFGHVGSLPPPA